MTYSLDELLLGCLLHDVGKLLQRGYPRLEDLTGRALDLESTLCPSHKGMYTHKHVLYTNAFFDLLQMDGLGFPNGIQARTVEMIASYHHSPDACPIPAAAWLCALGDRYSAGMDRREDEETSERSSSRTAFRTTPLQCIFDEVILDRKALGSPGRHAYELIPLDPDDAGALIPDEWPAGGARNDLPGRYLSLWQQFRMELTPLCSTAVSFSPRLFEESLLGLLERYMWAIPSSTVSAPDISLYDHARTTAAVAVALFRFHEDLGQLEDIAAIKDESKPKFRFLAGDLSGIQSTLFTLQSQGVKGVNKILRARSFLLGAIAESAALMITEKLGLPCSSIVQQAGGRFLVLVPALEKLEQVVDGLREHFDHWLLERYTGSLALNLALSEPFPGAAFKSAGLRPVMVQLGQAIDEAKQRPLANCAQGVMRREFPHDAACMACGVRPGEKAAETGYRCPACHQEFLLGKRLIHAGALAWGHALPKKWQPIDVLGLDLALLESPPEEIPPGIVSLRRTRELPTRVPWALRSLANHIPLFKDDHEARNPRYDWIRDKDLECGAGDPKSFMHIASEALEPESDKSLRGRAFLGLIKADVDYLGFIFGQGLRRDDTQNDRLTLSRVAQLSRMLDLYFTGYLKGLLHREFPDTYTVYAGGDDLLLIGPWRQTLQLASRINETFRAYTGHNPNITLSAGVTLLKPHYPVNRAVRQAEMYLERAKDQGRNRVCALLDKPIPWERYAERLMDAEWIHQKLQGPSRVSTGFVYRILELAEDAEAVALRGDIRKAGWRARLAYHLARNIQADKKIKAQRIAEWLERLGLDDQFRLLGDHSNVFDWRLPLTIALYRNRT